MSNQVDEKKGFSWLSLLFAPYYYAGYGKFSKGLLFAIIGFIPLTQIIVNIYAGVKAKKELPVGKQDFRWGAAIGVLVIHWFIQGSVYYFSPMGQQEINGIEDAAYTDTQVENTLIENVSSGNEEHITTDLKIGQDYIETEAKLLGYAERDWGCISDFIINGEKLEVEGCPENKSIYENNVGKILKLRYKTGMVEGFKTYYFVGVSNSAELYDKTREKSRVYATLEMGTSEEYNKEAIRKIKENNNKFAGFALRYGTDESGIIDIITLNSPTDNLLSIVISHAAGQKPDNAWSLEKIEEIVNKLKNQYRKIDENEEVIEYDLGTVQNQILKYHEMRDSPSQADYDADVRNAHAIQNLKSVFIFDNKGDNIIVTVKACIEGNENTTPELLLSGDIYQNSLTIEYKSKSLVELENKNRDAQLRKERAKEKKEASEMESL